MPDFPLPKGGDPQGTVRVNPVASVLQATTDHKTTIMDAALHPQIRRARFSALIFTPKIVVLQWSSVSSAESARPIDLLA